MKNKTRIYFRADGNSDIGLGHVIRSLALAEMLNSYFECHFIIRNPDAYLRNQILDICDYIVELEAVNDLEIEAHFFLNYLDDKSIVVLDGYQFDTNYQKIIKRSKSKLVCIDDIHACHFVADAIINHAGGTDKRNYSVESYTKLYFGLDYLLLRKPFREAAKNKKQKEQETAIFICLGGADPKNDILNVLKECAKQSVKEKLYIVVGSAYLHLTSLKKYLLENNLDFQLLSNLSAEQMVNYMSKCPVAITSPSSISYEYLNVGGMLYLYKIAENQEQMLRYLTSQRLALTWNDFPEQNENLIQEVLTNQEKIFNGDVDKKLYKIFRNLNNDINSKLRLARSEDLMLLFHWTNDPSTRAQSFNNNSILLEDHSKWFLNKIKSPFCYLYILEDENNPVGQIRFDIKNEEALISYSIDEKFRKKGFGKILLEKGLKRFKVGYKNKISIVAYVKKSNFASIYVFQKLNFEKHETFDYENSFRFVK